LLNEHGILARSVRKRFDDVVDVVEFDGDGHGDVISGERHCSRIVPGRIRRRAELLYAIHGCKVVKCENPDDEGD
jgi:hypothetical protein